MRVIVTDANVLIDMEVGELLDTMFSLLGLEFVVPDVLFVEELQEQLPQLPSLGLRSLRLSPEGVHVLEELKAKYPRPGFNDLMALTLAKMEACPLLSGDGPLREAAMAEEIEVHGTLWLMDQLFQAGLVNVATASAAYERMKADCSRLPWAEVERQLQRWGAL